MRKPTASTPIMPLFSEIGPAAGCSWGFRKLEQVCKGGLIEGRKGIDSTRHGVRCGGEHTQRFFYAQQDNEKLLDS
jgi:hypothetical protein